MKAIPFYISIFVILLGVLVILVFSHYQITQDKIGTMEESYNIKARQLSTDFEIINVAHEDNLTITILNTGSEKLLPNRTTVFMPLLRESTTIIDPDFNLINPLLFDPGERAHIIIEEEIEYDKEKNVTIVTENSARKSISFIKKIIKLNIETAKNSNSGTEQKELINSSNNVYSEIQIQTDSEAFLWINYSLNKISIQDAIINIEHYFDNSSDIEAYIEYKEKNGWVTIGQLSNFETKGIDNFYLNEEAENYRIRYYSNNINTITSFVDNFEIIANITSWKDIS